MWEDQWYFLSKSSWSPGGLCVDLGSCACVHPFMKLWNSYKGSLNGPALIGKKKRERSNSKITLNHMSWLIKIMCGMSLKFGRKTNKCLGLYAPFFGTQNTSQRSYLLLRHRHRCHVKNYCAFIKIIWNQEQFNF